ncbi:MAG: histidine kinase [Betaproteobacteria bacterium]|nr:histidine kinase [Betaproteobacteria bacterium]
MSNGDSLELKLGDITIDAASRRSAWRVKPAVAASWLGLWSFLWLAHSLTSYGSLQRQGKAADLATLLSDYLWYYVPWFLFSLALFAFLDSRRDRLIQPARIVTAYAVSATCFLVPYLLYVALRTLHLAGKRPAGLQSLLDAYPPVFWFIDLVLFTGCFGAVLALAAVRATLAAERRQREAERENLTLKVDLERQRMATLMAQFEPHFLFNALNAISGLVRGNETGRAVEGISQLGQLLRHVLQVGRAERSSLGDELDFVSRYLALQQMRHGDRLEIVTDGMSADLQDIACPPLILQPLVENALRHGIETHGQSDHISISVTVSNADAVIRISNTRLAGKPSNPGLGLGLANIRDRLRLAYGGAAGLETGEEAGRFMVTLRIPVEPGAGSPLGT